MTIIFVMTTAGRKKLLISPLFQTAAVCLCLLVLPVHHYGQTTQKLPIAAEQLAENIRSISFSGDRIDFVFSNTEVRDLIAHLETYSGLHFDLSPDVKGMGTYHMRDVPWDQALAAVLSDFKLNIDPVPGGLKIFTGRKYVLAFHDGKKVKTFMFFYEHFSSILFSLLILTAAVVGFILIRKSRAKRNKPHKKGLLDKDQADHIEKELFYLLEVKKIYRDDKLTLVLLSEKLKITPHQLSWIINQRQKKSFPSLINHYRVEDVKAKLAGKQPGGTSILQAAFEAGFSTKTAFNRAFKQMTGVTPSQYRSGLGNGNNKTQNSG